MTVNHAAGGGLFPDPINLKWDYETDGAYDFHKADKEINSSFQDDVILKGKLYKNGRFLDLEAEHDSKAGASKVNHFIDNGISFPQCHNIRAGVYNVSICNYI